MNLVKDIDADLAISSKSLDLLPSSARRAVTAAQLLFESLNRQIEKTPASELIDRRISVSSAKKLWVLLRSMIGAKA